MEVVFDSHAQMEGSCTEATWRWPVYCLTPNTGQSFLTSRFERESILSLVETLRAQEIDARSDSGCEEIQIVKKVLEPNESREEPHEVTKNKT
jgi:hypothetical protein